MSLIRGQLLLEQFQPRLLANCGIFNASVYVSSFHDIYILFILYYEKKMGIYFPDWLFLACPEYVVTRKLSKFINVSC